MAQIDSSILTRVRAFLEKLDQEGIHIQKAYIFGSYATGRNDKWSDIDVAVVSHQISHDRFEERIRLTKVAISIDDRLEPLPFNVSDFAEDNPLVKKIMAEGIPVA